MFKKLMDKIAEDFVLLVFVFGIFTVPVVGMYFESQKKLELEIIKEQVKLEQLKIEQLKQESFTKIIKEQLKIEQNKNTNFKDM